MTSKDKLDTIRWRYVSAMFPNKPDKETMIYIEEIEKDLDVLEIIQPMLKIEKRGTWEYLNTKHGLFDTREELEKVKEWLEDDK